MTNNAKLLSASASGILLSVYVYASKDVTCSAVPSDAKRQ